MVNVRKEMAKYLRRSFRRKKEVRFLENETEDLVEVPVVRYRPDGLDALCRSTKFARKELQLMYRSFKQECPNGLVNEATFKRIYSQFFPQGDVSQYAHYVFNAFDVRHTGVISFEEFVMCLSVLSRGSACDKLRWAFNLYDLDGDGVISRQELREVVGAVHRLMGAPPKLAHGTSSAANLTDLSSPSTSASAAAAGTSTTAPYMTEDMVTDQHADKIFQKLDLNKDGLITMDEFLETCLHDDVIAKTMVSLDLIS